MLQDLRFGLKLLWKEKAFSVTALLTLALCIGANTAIFTVLNAVVLAPLPFPQPDRLVTLYNVYPGVGVERGSNGVPDYLDRRRLTDVFERVCLIGYAGYDVGAAGSPQRLDGQYVTPDYFQVFGIQPLLGRTFLAEEATLGKEKVAVLSYGLWRDLFAADPNVLGKDIRLSGEPYRVVGVMPDGFATFTRRDPKVWVPFAFRPEQTTDDARHNNSWGMVARLRSRVTLAGAQRRIDALNKLNIERIPKFRKLLEDARFGTRVAGLRDEIVRDVRPTLYLLQAAVAFVLLIGCVNVANLMLVRSNIRMKELAIRFSLGAGRLRLGRQLLTESVTLALLGGLLGVAVGLGGLRLLFYIGAKELPRSAAIALDAHALAFSAAVALAAGLAFGSVPIFHLFRRNLSDVFRNTERAGTAHGHALWTRSALVVCQVSLAFVLLIGAGLLTASFWRLLDVSPGFRPENVLTARFSLPRVRYKDDVPARNFVANLLETARAIPGVRHAGATTYLPFGGDNNASVIMIQGHVRAPGENPPVPGWNMVDAGYFPALGIPLLRGRTFAESDAEGSQRVAIIDEFLARRYWPKGSPLGAAIKRGIDNDDKPWTIVGVVGSVKTGDLAEQNPVGQIYFPYKQMVPRAMHLVLRTERDDPRVISAARRELQRADPELPLFDVKTMPERLSASLTARRAAMVLCLIFAGLALLLSAIGIYGVLAYAVAQRTREFGIRVALGAGAPEVLRMVAGQGLKLAAIGLALGLAGAFALTRLMASLLYAVRPTDPVVFLCVAAALAVVALVASLVPSLRALRIRPAMALRYE